MKKQPMLIGSANSLAVLSLFNTSASFLSARQEVIRLAPTVPSPNAGYVWRRIFLRGKGHRE